VVLDAFGKPSEANAWQLDFKSKAPGTWTKMLTRHGSARAFGRSLPDWARKKLWLTAGFLAANPGQPPVSYGKTSAEDAIAIADVALGLAPGLAKTAVLSVVENALKMRARSALAAAVTGKQVRWGHGNDITHEKATEFTTRYIGAGKSIWRD